jgi:hypothetical protein
MVLVYEFQKHLRFNTPTTNDLLEANLDKLEIESMLHTDHGNVPKDDLATPLHIPPQIELNPELHELIRDAPCSL